MNSEDLSQFEGLSPSDQAQLTELLDAYLRGLEEGHAPDRDRLVQQHPHLASRLTPYLESLDFLKDAAAGFCADAPPTSCGVAEDDAPPHKQVGDFRIVREIGRGGMGVVYEAWQISLDRRVALKVLPFAALLDSKQITRFRNEARAAAQLQHAHIVPVYAVGVERGAHYYAMQFIEGQPLDRAIAGLREAGPQSVAQANANAETLAPLATAHSRGSLAYFHTIARLGRQAAEALHAAHESGIVHRDIKPSNLLLDADSKLWITDFGLARCRWETNLTGPGDVLGTIRYMSPEQMHGQGKLVDHRTDIYSLGITLYELLTLHHAIRGTETVAICREVERNEPYPLRLWNPKIPVDLETIIQKAIGKDPSERYATAQEMAEDLARFLNGQPTLARRPTAPERAVKWMRRHKRLVAGTAGALVLGVIGLSIATLLLAREKGHTERALAEAHENFQRYRAQLALATHHLGVLQNQNGERQQAEQSFLEARRLQTEALQERPDDEQALRELAATLDNLSFLYADGDAKRAAACYEEAVRTHERLIAVAPTNETHQHELAQARANYGSFQARQGDGQTAVPMLQEAIVALERIALLHPQNPAPARELAIIYNNLGMVQKSAGSLADAEHAFRSAQRWLAPLLETSARSPGDASSLGGVCNNLAMTLEAADRPDEAAAAYVAAIEQQKSASLRSPQSARYRELLARHYFNYGRLLRQQGRPAQALEAAQARRELCRTDARRLVAAAEELASIALDLRRSSDIDSKRLAAQSEASAIAALQEAAGLGLDVAAAIQASQALSTLQNQRDTSEWLASDLPSNTQGNATPVPTVTP